jgi:hypothetical protein
MNTGTLTALIAVLSFAAPVALAQPTDQPNYYSQDELMGFRGTAESLIDATRKIERMTGGKIAEIRFTDADGVRGYHAVVMKGGQAQFMLLEEKSGRLAPILHKSEPVWMLHWRGQVDAHLVEGAKVPLDRAIRTAEKAEDNQPAIAAGIARSAANPDTSVHAWNVLIDRDGVAKRVAVDDSTGQVITNPQALAGWPS